MNQVSSSQYTSVNNELSVFNLLNMIEPKEFFELLKKNNIRLITGVPCSYFKETLAYLSQNTSINHVVATREDEAIGIASGASFSGNMSLVYMQNSGLGNIGDALTSLAQLYDLPMLLLVSWRGLAEDKDFPEHSIIGQINEQLLEAFQIPYFELLETNWQETMKKAIDDSMLISKPIALLVKKGVLCQ